MRNKILRTDVFNYENDRFAILSPPVDAWQCYLLQSAVKYFTSIETRFPN